MLSKIFCAALITIATAASAQTINRTVSENGKIVYSEAPVSDTSARGSQVRTYSSAESGRANSLKPVADSGDGSPGGNGACRADATKFCAQSGGGKAAFECLLDHQQDISDACYDSLKKQMTSGQATQNAPSGMQACKPDVRQLCRDVQPGQGRIINCLLDHQNDISEACYSALEKQKQRR